MVLAVDWVRVFDGCGFGRVGLPSYAFQRERFWLSGGGGVGDVRSVGLGVVGHPLLGGVVGLGGGEGLLFTGRVSISDDPWLSDHAVMGTVLLAGTAFLEMVGRAGREVGCGVIRDLTLEAPLVLADHPVQLQVMLDPPGEDGSRAVSVYSRPEDTPGEDSDAGDGWTRHASGVLEPGPKEKQAWNQDALEDVLGEQSVLRLWRICVVCGPRRTRCCSIPRMFMSGWLAWAWITVRCSRGWAACGVVMGKCSPR